MPFFNHFSLLLSITGAQRETFPGVGTSRCHRLPPALSRRWLGTGPPPAPAFGRRDQELDPEPKELILGPRIDPRTKLSMTWGGQRHTERDGGAVLGVLHAETGTRCSGAMRRPKPRFGRPCRGAAAPRWVHGRTGGLLPCC